MDSGSKKRAMPFSSPAKGTPLPPQPEFQYLEPDYESDDDDLNMDAFTALLAEIEELKIARKEDQAQIRKMATKIEQLEIALANNTRRPSESRSRRPSFPRPMRPPGVPHGAPDLDGARLSRVRPQPKQRTMAQVAASAANRPDPGAKKKQFLSTMEKRKVALHAAFSTGDSDSFLAALYPATRSEENPPEKATAFTKVYVRPNLPPACFARGQQPIHLFRKALNAIGVKSRYCEEVSFIGKNGSVAELFVDSAKVDEFKSTIRNNTKHAMEIIDDLDIFKPPFHKSYLQREGILCQIVNRRARAFHSARFKLIKDALLADLTPQLQTLTMEAVAMRRRGTQPGWKLEEFEKRLQQDSAAEAAEGEMVEE
jgi:hypothetical protein